MLVLFVCLLFFIIDSEEGHSRAGMELLHGAASLEAGTVHTVSGASGIPQPRKRAHIGSDTLPRQCGVLEERFVHLIHHCIISV